MIVIEYDPKKNKANVNKHGISLDRAELFEWQTAIIISDARKNYGEVRFSASGYIDERLHIIVFTQRGAVTRVISLRKANRREQRNYAKETQI